MLPLNTFEKHPAAKELLEKEGYTEDDLLVAFYEDLLIDGNFGEEWLLIDKDIKTLLRIVPGEDLIEKTPLETLKNPYVDNYNTSNRLLATTENEDGTKKTVILGCCTNACKRYLMAFLNIWERNLKEKGSIGNDDPLFDQFNARCPKCGTVYADQRRRICEKCSRKKGIIIRLLSYFKEFKLQFACVLFCLIMSSAISLLTPIVSGQVLYDQVISEPTFNEAGEQITGKLHSENYVFVFVGILFGMAIIALLIGILQNRCNAMMSTHVSRRMKIDLFSAMSKLSLSYFNQNATGRLINRVNYDAVRIRSFYIDGVPHLIVHLLNFIGLTIFLFSINWKLTLIVFIPVPIIVVIFKTMLPKLWRSYSTQWRRSSTLNAVLNDSLSGTRVVKAFAKEDEEGKRFRYYATKLYDANLRTNLTSITIFPVVSLLIGISSQAIWGFGGVQVMHKFMTYGQLTTYIGYLGMIFGPLNFFSTFTNMLTDTINAATRMYETLDMIPEITNAPDPVKIDTIRGSIRFDHVYFHYSPNKPILKDVSFEIKEGDNVGVVGHTGSGKSTIANLITRMYDVISGSVSIDGINVKDIEMSSLRRNVAIVSQEIFLFHGTIADNIRYARPDATMEEVIEAAKSANAHDFIMRLPEGYETLVGIGHRALSGGERQRISIARAILLKPSLLILDEATAAMDNETECRISEAVDKLVKGKTTITIAHRLSTLKNCNVIMAVENGEVAEMGSAEELLEKKGVYYKLYTLQNEQMQQVVEGK